MNDKPLIPFWMIISSLLLTITLLVSCSPSHAQDKYASTNEALCDNYVLAHEEQWCIRHNSALESVANGSVLTYEEIMDLYWNNDAEIKERRLNEWWH